MRPPGSGSDEPPKHFSLTEQKSLLKAFLAYYPRHKKLLALDISIVCMTPLVATVTPAIVYKALQAYLPDRNIPMLTACVCLLFFLTLCNIAGEYIKTRWGHTLGVRMESDMRADMFAHLQKLSFTYFDRTKTGHLMSRIANDLTMIAEVAHHCPEDIISAFLMLTGGLSVMLWINPWLTLLTFLPVPFMIFWGTVYHGRMRETFRRVRHDIAEINSRVENSIQGVREVQSYTNETYEMAKFRTVNENFRISRESSFSVLASFHSGMMFFIHGYSVIFIGLGVMMICLGWATAPELITFFMYSNQIHMPVMNLVHFVEQYQQGMAAFERFREVMLERPEIEDAPDALRVLPAPLHGEIVFDRVSFRYAGSGACAEDVLKEVSLTVPAGHMLAVVGESGAGKTTLAALIPRFYDVRAGSVLLDGRDIRSYARKLLRSNVGIVQQTPFLFDTTIRENILFGRPDATENDLIQAAKSANIYEFVMELPDRFDAMCGENGVRLSGGQKQRISLARVFLKNPPVLIFDEATSALDNQSEALVQDAVDRLCRGRTTIVIAHRLSTVKNANYICCMKKGRIVEQGTHAELLARNGYYSELYHMHSF